MPALLNHLQTKHEYSEDRLHKIQRVRNFLRSTMLVSLDAVASLLSGEELDHESRLPRSLHKVAVHLAPVDANNSTPCLECDVRNVTFRVSRSVTETVPISVPDSVPVQNLLFSHSPSSSRPTVCRRS